MVKLERDHIDSWRVAESGLSERVLNCAEREGVKTIGELRRVGRDELLNWRHFGVGSLKEVEAFFDYCGDLESGRSKFTDIPDVLAAFLSSDELLVLVKRYGLERRESEVSRNYYTLQEIANRRNLTRERVRQIESIALARLATRLLVAQLAPFRDQVFAAIESAGGLMACETLCRWRTSIFRSYSPCATTLLLSDLPESKFRYERGVFASRSSEEMDMLYLQLLEALEEASAPLAIDELAASAATGPDEIFSILAGLKNLLLTKDGRVIYSKSSLNSFFYELLGSKPARFHYKQLGKWANAQLDQRTQKGYGHYLHRLLDMDSFERQGFGEYEPRMA